MHAVALNDADEQGPRLVIETPAGRLTGRWRGSGVIRAGEVFDVELDLGRPRSWAELTTHAGADHSRVRGHVEHADDDVVVIRIGETIALLEISGDLPADAVGKTVGVPAEDLEFYPTGI